MNNSPTDEAPPTPAQALPSKRNALRLLFFIMLMDVVGITILYPVTPFIVGRYSDEALMVTLIGVIYAAAQFFAAPVLGKLGDRYGRRPVLLWSLAGSVVGYVIFGIGGALSVLFLSRLIDGISGGNMSTASAYIADISEPEDRAQNFSLIGIAWGVGLILGPALGSVFGQISVDAPAFLAALLVAISLVLAFFLLPESLPKERRELKPLTASDLNPFISIGAMASRAGLGPLLLVLCLFNFAFNGINSIQGLFVLQKFAAEPWQVGLLLVLIGIAVIIVQSLLVRRFVAQYGEKRLAIASLWGQAAASVAVFFAPIFGLVYVFGVLSSAISGFTFPTLTTLTTSRVAPREQGALMGVTTALSSSMSIIGPLSAGILYDHVMTGAPYWIGALIFTLAALVLMRTNRQQGSITQ